MESIRSEKNMQLLKINFHFVSFLDPKKDLHGFALICSRADRRLRALFVRFFRRDRWMLSVRAYGPKSYQMTLRV
jgi:hypothetical protein